MENLEYVCKCSNCGQFLLDVNPQTNTKKINIKNVSLDELEYFTENDETFSGCPKCETDSYLMDLDEIDINNLLNIIG